MTNSISNDVRAALEGVLKNVVGIPPIEYDGVPLEPTPTSPYAVATMISGTSRPAVVGIAPYYRSEGILGVTLFYPVGGGAHDLENMGDAICAAFPVDTVITQGNAKVRIAYAETNGQVRVEAGLWLTLAVSISWYIYF